MKYCFTIFIFISTVGFGQVKNLKLHYNFTSDTGGIVSDVTGNGYDATLINGATVEQYGDRSVLNLGMSNGYLDLGTKAGLLIKSLKNFTISTQVAIDEMANLNAYGNFLWSFSNSNDILSNQNGCMFFSVLNQRYSITKTDYNKETGIEAGAPVEKNQWKHIVYTQTGNQAEIYIDGILVKSGSVTLSPGILGHTRFNYIGRSPYVADVYLKGLIADFKIFDAALNQEEIRRLGAEHSSLNEYLATYKQKPVRLEVTSNPLFSHRFTADPAALVHDETFYLYCGEDTGDGNGYDMPNWLVFSTTDMKTWYQHPIPLRTSDFKWATGNTSWASQVVHHNGKFYWYVSTEHSTIPGKAIGVAVSDSPTGPFKDAIGEALVTNNQTTQWTGISWDDIDPTVWVDDDGQAYLFWGNTQCYYAKLKDNMIELDSPIMPVTLPNFTEAPWIHKHNGWYYLSYATGFPERIAYAMSKSLEGPWEYKGIINGLAGNSNTNHQAIVEYKNNWYFVYHNGGVQSSGGSYHRSVCIDYLYYNEDGTIKRILMTDEGVDKINK